MPLLLNKAKKTRSKNYVRLGFSVTKAENTKVERKISVKYQADAMNTLEMQLLAKTLSWKLEHFK